MKIRHSRQGFTLIELLVVISIIAILASLAVPASIGVVKKANQMKDLNNAKQIYLGLKMYSGDNDGIFPTTMAVDGTTPIVNANDAFKNLIPQYIGQEKIFYIPKSAWCNSAAPDEKFTADADKLSGGENGYAYVKNLSDTSNPGFPLIADGFSTTVGTYATSETAKGGLWGGTAAVVIRVDGSGKIEKCKSTDQKVYGRTGDATDSDIFAGSANWLSTGGTKPQVPLNPADPLSP